jgi:hypothetical protein
MDPIISIPSNTSLSFASSLNMDALITSFQKHMVKAPPYSSYPVVNLLVSYASDSFPALVGPPWYLTSIVSTIHKVPHTSILTSDAIIFVRNEVQEMVQRSFSIVPSVDDALTYFGTHLRNSRLASMDQTKPITSPGSYATFLQSQTPPHLLSMPPLTLPPTRIPSNLVYFSLISYTKYGRPA